MPKLDAAIEMLDLVLPPGARLSVSTLKAHALDFGVSWRTVNEAKRRAGNIRSVKQRGHYRRHNAGWVWGRE